MPTMRAGNIVVGTQPGAHTDCNGFFANVDVNKPRHLPRSEDVARLEFKLTNLKHALIKLHGQPFRKFHNDLPSWQALGMVMTVERGSEVCTEALF